MLASSLWLLIPSAFRYSAICFGATEPSVGIVARREGCALSLNKNR